ncbi:PH domain-containing protein [Marinilactibacillus sp. Marseille-P9653]|uniref:PH domain-containing protein n=1 Tax=Marinilactibacillus sp. Marseille-P9653 TaxID=2866583 RepID=UPI001CE49411|nr:PH domain-containing protein [Marinilactibacillus sp. Marseille-P9653]
MIEEQAPSNQLDATVIRYDKTHSLVIGIFYILGCVGLVWLINWFDWPFIFAILSVIVTIVSFCMDYFILPYLRYKSIRYEVHPTYLEILKGVFFRTREIIPIERVQQVSIEDGPLSRRYQVQIVEIQTAGTSHRVPLLLEEDAQALKVRIMDLIKEVQSDV